jgi:hypothetical protein
MGHHEFFVKKGRNLSAYGGFIRLRRSSFSYAGQANRELQTTKQLFQFFCVTDGVGGLVVVEVNVNAADIFGVVFQPLDPVAQSRF